ncbi:MAG: hypothetical protein ABIF87_12835 [Pseudomonadota bacterium]
MKWFLFGISLLWVMGGTLIVFNTELVRRRFFDKIKTTSPKKLSPVPIIVGGLLILSASASSQDIIIFIIGVLALLKGVLFLMAPEEKVKVFIDWWLSGSDQMYKGLGIFMTILGTFILGTMIA